MTSDAYPGSPGGHTGIPEGGSRRTVDTYWHRAPEVMGCQTVFVLGHATYYPRHGFELCAGDKGYPVPYPIPEEHKACWMMQPLTAQLMNVTGHIQCAQVRS